MAAILAILNALRRTNGRDLRTFQSLGINNFVLFAGFLTYSSLAGGTLVRHGKVQVVAALPFILLLGFPLLFVLSRDPMHKVPASRLALWPMTHKQHLTLRLTALIVSPVLWIALIVLLATRSFVWMVLFLGAAVVIAAVSVVGRRIAIRLRQAKPRVWIPLLPGATGSLISNHLRQILTQLDIYVALLLSVGILVHRVFSPNGAGNAMRIAALLIALAFSTYAQCLFGVDSDSALSRLRLFPLRGWRIILAKDASYLALLTLLLLPAEVVSGLVFGLTALIVGRYPAVVYQTLQQRWRFTGGSMKFSIVQILAGTGLALFAADHAWVLPVAVLVWIVSIIPAGWYWDQIPE